MLRQINAKLANELAYAQVAFDAVYKRNCFLFSVPVGAVIYSIISTSYAFYLVTQ